jgi:Holliday junction DNA helicase RuvA
MIAYLEGEIIGIGEDNLVLRVGGLGVKVYVPIAIRAQARPGETMQLFTHLVVREDSLTLFGFEKQEDSTFFNLLLGVNGVGPRTALAILSSLTVETMRRAVLSEMPDIFARVSGVGKKTAQKIILYLQGKVGTGVVLEGMPASDVDAQVIDALTALGYSIVEAQTALQSLPRDAPQDLESRLRLALQYFST